jgi:hypothetical protein
VLMYAGLGSNTCSELYMRCTIGILQCDSGLGLGVVFKKRNLNFDAAFFSGYWIEQID